MVFTCRGIFETEAEAEDFALNGDERLWALVVFKEGPSASGVDYTIRHNFTTVPTTWVTVNKYRHSVPIDYKVCCTCQQFSCRVCRYGVLLQASKAGHAAQCGKVGALKKALQASSLYNMLGRDFEVVFQAI